MEHRFSCSIADTTGRTNSLVMDAILGRINLDFSK